MSAMPPPSGGNPSSSDKYAFLRMPAPPSYVAGLGRGASGFTTRSDIGPAREGPSQEAIQAAMAKRGDGAGAGAGGGAGGEEEEEGNYNDPDNETGLFAGTVYEADDEEADSIYSVIDNSMDSRRRARREAREKEELTKLRSERPTIQLQFADLKRGLSEVSDQEWDSLPEVGNLTGRGGKRRRANLDGRAFMVPDSVLVGAREGNQLENSLSERQMDGVETPANVGGGSGGMLTDLTEIGQARNSVLSLKLDQIKDSVGGSSTIDPKGYLTSLDSVVLKTDAEIGDIKKARSLLDSVIKTNPKHSPGWIAAARVEEVAGKMVAARKLIWKGCEECPKSEDVWIEAARLNTNENAKIILANAVQHLPNSVRIFLRAAELEHDLGKKKKVFRKALEYIPNSVKLWKEAVKLEENPNDARLMLSRAVEVVPLSSELWLALARLEVPDRARGVLNKARKTIPTSHEIWIAAGRLQEQESTEDDDKVDLIISNGVESLKKHGVDLKREQWLREAEKCEKQGSIKTCQAIIKASIHLDLEEEDRQQVWLDEAESCEKVGNVETARAIYAVALGVFPNKPTIWRKAAELEKNHGPVDALLSVLESAVTHCPHAEVLWLMAAKEAWMSGDVQKARSILEKAFEANDESESIWLAAAKLEAENGELVAAKTLLARARAKARTERVWMQSVVFERKHGSLQTALSLLTEALPRFSTSPKFYMMKAQILSTPYDYSSTANNNNGMSVDDGKKPLPPKNEFRDVVKARETLATGVRKCPKSVALWILSARLELDNTLGQELATPTTDGTGVAEKDKGMGGIKARAIMEKARYHNPKDEELWRESIAIEERVGSGQAKGLMARALQECPQSGILWSDSVWMEPRPTRKTRSVDALKKTNNHPVVIVTVARLFWAERKIEKARNWFERAVKADEDLGDAWGWWLKFEQQHGTKEQQDLVVNKCIAIEPHHGPTWQAVAKSVENQGKLTKEILKLVVGKLAQ